MKWTLLLGLLLIATLCSSSNSKQQFKTVGSRLCRLKAKVGLSTLQSSNRDDPITLIASSTGVESASKEPNSKNDRDSAANTEPQSEIINRSESHGILIQNFKFFLTEIQSKPKLVRVVCLINSLVYFFWQFAPLISSKAKPFLVDNFTSSIANFKKGKLWVFLTSSFTHANIYHLVSNMVTFAMLSPPVVEVIGNKSFVSLLLFSAVASSLVTNILNYALSIVKSIFGQKKSNENDYQLGFSGINAGITTAFSLLFPYAPMNLMGIATLSSIDALIMLFSMDCIGMLAQNIVNYSSISHSTHIAGYLAGLAFMTLSRKRDYRPLLHLHTVYVKDRIIDLFSQLANKL